MKAKITHKFKAQNCELDGIKFASKKEGKRYKELKMQKETGNILFFLRQVPIHLGPKTKYLCDFLIFWRDGNVTFEDVKGFKTDLYKTKKSLIESMYPIKIEEV